MDSIINELETKVRMFKSNPSQQLVHEIESLLRDLKSRAEIPDHFKVRIAAVINQLGNAYNTNTYSQIPQLTLSVITKIKGNVKPKATAGEIAVQGQQEMRRNSNDPLSAYKIMRKFGKNLWRL